MLPASPTSSELDLNLAAAVDTSAHIVDVENICNSAANASEFDEAVRVVSVIQIAIKVLALIDDY